MKRMLVNATQREELRVAMVDGQRLYDLDIEVPSKEQRKANIYKGRITRIEPSLEAAFIDYGAARHGFLPLKEISNEYFVREPGPGERVQIRDVLKEGQEIVVQVEKEERGNKGAALTTYVSLAGRFLVLMPNNPGAGGVSRRITGEDRDIVRDSLAELNAPESMGCIVRTAGVGRSTEELRWDLDYLLNVWESIKNVVVTRPAPFLIYQEGNAIVRALRDYLTNDIGEVLIDNPDVHRDAYEFMERVLPHNLRKLKLYEDPVPLFTRFQIESQIESAFAHSVSLPSGGSVVIDHTEALTAIDINSARSTKGEDIEETALNTNLEAAEEISRQLRIRDLGGLVVVDFIDMGPHRNQRDVENRLRDAVKQDRARIQIGKISRFGLLELSRQRLRPSLEESTQLVCPRCSGNGVVRSVESLALAVLRIVGEEARKERTAKVIAQVPIEVSNYVLNEKRNWVQAIQDENGVSIVIVGDEKFETPNYVIRRVRDDELQQRENVGASYSLVEPKEDPTLALRDSKPPPKPEPAAVSTVLPTAPAPQPSERAPRRGPSLLTRLFGWMFAGEEPETDQPARGRRHSNRGRDRSRDRDRKGGQSARRGRDRSSNRQGRGRSSDKQNQPRSTREQGGQGTREPSGQGTREPSGQGTREQSGQGSSGGGRSRRSRSRRSHGSGQGQADAPRSASAPGNGQKGAGSENASARERQNEARRRPEGQAPPGNGEDRKEAAPPKTDSDGGTPPEREPAADSPRPNQEPHKETRDAPKPEGREPSS